MQSKNVLMKQIHVFLKPIENKTRGIKYKCDAKVNLRGFSIIYIKRGPWVYLFLLFKWKVLDLKTDECLKWISSTTVEFWA